MSAKPVVPRHRANRDMALAVDYMSAKRGLDVALVVKITRLGPAREWHESPTCRHNSHRGYSDTEGNNRMVDERRAIQLVEANLAAFEQGGWTYVVESSKKHADRWAVAVRPFNPEGKPAYDLLGFEVNAVTGDVTQWS